MRFQFQRQRVASHALGVALALLATDILLRPFTTGMPARWHLSPLESDSLEGPAITYRYYHEGIAESHFSPVHARLTGAAPLAGAAVGVILGDSYVEAMQVADTETTGSVVERLARSKGAALNVRQYGWSGASLRQYLKVSQSVLDRWQPRWVAIMLNAADLTVEAAAQPPFEFPPAPGAPRTLPRGGARGIATSIGRWTLERSPLAYELMLSGLELSTAAPGDAGPPSSRAAEPLPESADLPPAVVQLLRELQAAYGPRLILLYVAGIPADPAVRDDTTELRLLRACAQLGVRCAGTADAMRQARDRDHRLSRGFVNGPPGQGHPNALGHRLLGEALWRAIPR